MFNRGDKRGLSAIVATLLIILLTLVAVGIIWVVVRNVIQSGAEQVSLGKFTLNLEIKNVVVNITNSSINVKIKRNAGEGETSGLKFIIEDGENAEVVEVNLSLNELEERTITLPVTSAINLSRIEKVSVAPIFKLESGKEVVGDVKDEYIISTNSESEETPCTLDCTGKECGSDGCGGSCGTCDLPNSTSQCNATYKCEILSCDSYFANCDSSVLNGCETLLGTTENCASCGDACSGGQTCNSSRMCDSSIEDLMWIPDSAINSSLSSTGDATYLNVFVFYKDSSWYLIDGWYYGTFHGHAWNGSQWASNSTIISGLIDIGVYSRPTAFYMDESWYLIVGEDSSTFNGYVWSGTNWISNSTIISGLSGPGGDTAPNVFYKDSSWYMLAGNSSGFFRGFVWGGTGWIANSTINASLQASNSRGLGSVFQKDGTWYLLSSAGNHVPGFAWDGDSWNPNSIINASLPIIAIPTPSVFQKDGTWYMIAGDLNGNYNGFRYA